MAGLPEGAVFDPATGHVTWVPGPGQVGDYVVRVTATDGELSVTQPLVLRVTTEPVGASIIIQLTPSFPVLPGQLVTVQAAASGFVSVESLTMTVDGQAVALDAQGRARLT